MTAGSVGFDPATLANLADPFPVYADLRAQGPAVSIMSNRIGVFGRTRRRASCSRDPRFSSGMLGSLYAATLPPGALQDEMSHRINFLDPPDHPRVRGAVGKAFTPRRVSALRPWMELEAEAMVDRLEVVDGHVEVMDGLAHQLPSFVISELLGVSMEHRDRLTSLSDAITPVFGTSVTAAARAVAVDAAEEMHDVLGAELVSRRSEPRDDLLSALLEVGDDLVPAELMSLIATLYSAGHRTTRDLFGNGLELLLRRGHPLPTATDPRIVDEITRLATPTHYVARFANEAVDVGDVRVDAGNPVMVFLAAANRDPTVYDVPDEFDPERGGPPALSFAFGPHFCLGAALARAEVETMLAALAGRFPRARASAEPAPWHQRGPFRGLDELRIQVS